ncbi:MAG: ATP-binding cassette domain-containing protein [Candidatus Nanopelagicales bacterium]
MTAAIEAHDLVKVYSSRSGEVRALDGVDLEVPQGSVLGLLGPNGAGKTTTVRVLTTLLIPDKGTATVAGCDVVADADEVRRRIGLSGQYSAVDEYLTGRENLQMIGRLYHLGKKRSAERAAELLDRFDLSDAADRPVKGYSGGMRRRLDLAGALVAHPPVLFLDEPTTGLDPRSRLGLWEVIEGLVRDGTTLLLTTQYLEEADRLADTIAVVDHGRVIARGTSDELKSQVGGERLELVVASSESLDAARNTLARLGNDEPHVEPHTRTVGVSVTGGAQTLLEVLRQLDEQDIAVSDVGLHRPTLDDVFLTLTGQRTESEDEA